MTIECIGICNTKVKEGKVRVGEERDQQIRGMEMEWKEVVRGWRVRKSITTYIKVCVRKYRSKTYYFVNKMLDTSNKNNYSRKQLIHYNEDGKQQQIICKKSRRNELINIKN